MPSVFPSPVLFLGRRAVERAVELAGTRHKRREVLWSATAARLGPLDDAELLAHVARLVEALHDGVEQADEVDVIGLLEHLLLVCLLVGRDDEIKAAHERQDLSQYGQRRNRVVRVHAVGVGISAVDVRRRQALQIGGEKLNTGVEHLDGVGLGRERGEHLLLLSREDGVVLVLRLLLYFVALALDESSLPLPIRLYRPGWPLLLGRSGRCVAATSRDVVHTDHLRLVRLDRVGDLPKLELQRGLAIVHPLVLAVLVALRIIHLVVALVYRERKLAADRMMQSFLRVESQQDRRLVPSFEHLTVDGQDGGRRTGGWEEGVPADQITACYVRRSERVALEGMLYGDFASVLLAQQSANNGALLLPQSVSRDVVGYGEEHEGVEDRLELGALLARDEGVGARGIHDARMRPVEGFGKLAELSVLAYIAQKNSRRNRGREEALVVEGCRAEATEYLPAPLELMTNLHFHILHTSYKPTVSVDLMQLTYLLMELRRCHMSPLMMDFQ
ncbi:Vacuolar protein sorting-associated protein vps17 [Tolypocladium capitatum]|uniref:Vacuolar protein sorting-associated protein vps17 n=1 Tax=Tolypocladium capitatum TaxID=45235 RepID=A0A2K3QMH3_9HYPO|nr:Vacuolar protein sorting-associated protein vps17 [Tolypocladium capitatum]